MTNKQTNNKANRTKKSEKAKGIRTEWKTNSEVEQGQLGCESIINQKL